MKIIKSEPTATGKHVWLIEFSESELAYRTISPFEKQAKKIYDKTKLISDGLFYLSEIAKSIEDTR